MARKVARGEGLKAGQVVLTGGGTEAVEVRPGNRVRVLVDQLGAAQLFVAE